MNAISRPSRPPRTLTHRAGFTLLELMIAIVIIAILIGLLLPAVGSVRRAAREAEVRTDIGALESAVGKFREAFGSEPPSQITLYARAADWEASAVSRRHKGIIKQFWPQFDFANCGGASTGGAMATFTTPGNPTTLNLSGAECLVFFLGGMIDANSGAFVGFAKDPQRPFASSSGAGAITNREGPFYDFKGALRIPLPAMPPATGNDSFWAGRLSDKDGDWLPEYRDTLPQQANPYLYFNGVNGYRTDFPTSPWHNTDNYGGPQSMSMNNAYYENFVPTSAPGMSRAHKHQGIQIISPGADTLYGTGGLFNPTDTSTLSPADQDNITNIQATRLRP